jgi:hypothetical protein
MILRVHQVAVFAEIAADNARLRRQADRRPPNFGLHSRVVLLMSPAATATICLAPYGG